MKKNGNGTTTSADGDDTGKYPAAAGCAHDDGRDTDERTAPAAPGPESATAAVVSTDGVGADTASDEDTAELPVLRLPGPASGGPHTTAVEWPAGPPGQRATSWVRQMETEIEQLQARWQSLDAELERSEARAAALREAAQAKDGQLEQAASRAAVLEDRLQAIADERDELRRAVDAERSRALESRIEKDAVAAANDNLRTRLQDLETYIDGRKDSWASLNARVDGYRDDVAAAGQSLRNAEAKLAARDEQISGLEQATLELERRCSETEGQRRERDAAYQDIQSRLEAQIGENEQLRADADARGRETGQARAEAERQREVAASLTETLNAKERELRELQSRLEAGDEDRRALTMHNERLDAQVAELESMLTGRISEIEALGATLEGTRQEAQTLRNDLGKAETLTEHMEKKSVEDRELIIGLQAEVAELRVERDSVAQGLERADERIEALETKVEDAERAWTELRNQTVVQQLRIEDLERELAAKSAVIGAFDRNAERLTDLSRRLHEVYDDTLSAEASVEAEANTPRPQSLLDDEVLFGDDAPDDDHRETVLDTGTRRLEDDSILADLNFHGPIATARVRMFVALDDEFPGTEYALDKPVVTIGRSKKSDIRLQHLVVSRMHARLRSGAGGTVIEDAGSKNGITVNSRVIDTATLRDGDVVSLGGKLDFRYVELELPPQRPTH
jgi:chromosome segregation ATPase